MTKIGLIVEGGGMKCAYSAGILDRFLDDNIHFDECIGVSAGVGNLASYLGNQRGRSLRFYTIYPKHPEYMGIRSLFKTGSFFGLRYIYGGLSNSDGLDPLDFQQLMRDPAELYLTATDAKTGEARYFTKAKMKQDDYRAIMASCAIPAFCKPIEIDGRLYYDGGVADSIPIRKALDDGCDKVVLLLANPRSFDRQPQKYKLTYHFMVRKFPAVVKQIETRHLRYHETIDFINKLEKEGKVFVFAPSHPEKISTNTMDTSAMQKHYDLGLEDYDALREKLQAFMKQGT